jgi:acyl carrier protein
MPTYDESLAITKEIIARHMEHKRPIRAEDHIQNDLGLDSLSVMEVVSELEAHLDVNIPAAMFDGIHTVGDVAGVLVRVTTARAESEARL